MKMKLNVISTGSQGNCYILSNNGECLILDAGVTVDEIIRGCDYKFSNIAGALITHEHKDHSKSENKLVAKGVNVFAPYHEENPELVKKLGSFIVQAFELPHNDTKNYGFYIKTDKEKLLYLTDFEYCPYNFSNLKVNHILVECNYQERLITPELANYEHKVKGHCELNTCKTFVKTNNSNALRTVLLLHMGVLTCDSEECVDEIKKELNKTVSVDYARAGLEIILNNGECPF